MALQLSVAARNARLDAIETTISTTAKLLIYSGSAPANCAAAATGTLLATLTLPSDYFQAASSGAMQKSATAWTGTASAGSGATPTHFRLADNAGTTVGLQGTAGVGSGDLSFDGTITSGQTITISTFTLTDANS